MNAPGVHEYDCFFEDIDHHAHLACPRRLDSGEWRKTKSQLCHITRQDHNKKSGRKAERD